MKNRAAWMAPVCSLLIFTLFYAIYGLYPFGNRSIVWCDMEQQAVPLLLQLKGLLESGESLTYTVLDAGGMNFYGVYFFFLSNPFSYLCLLSDIPIDLLMNLLVPLKLALASATAAIYLRHRHGALSTSATLLLALMYGLSGYGLFYYQNIMWLDVQALLPLMLLALDLLLTRGKMLPYLLALCAQMVLCYYLGYMIVLYVLIASALALRWTTPPERRGAIACKLWWSSGLAALISAPVWLPSFLQVMRSARSGGLIHNLSSGYFVDGFFDKFSLIACTGLVFAALPFVWMNRREKSEQMRRYWMFGLLLSATVIDPINSMWHTGSYQAFPYRWAIIPILLCLSLAAEQMQESGRLPLTDCPTKQLSRSEWVALVLFPVGAVACCACLLRFGGETILSYVETLWVQPQAFCLMLLPTALVVCGYFLALNLYRRRAIGNRVLIGLCAVLFATEFTLSFHCYVGGSADADALYAQTVSAAGRIADDDFYRVKLTRKYAHANMVGALGYPTMAHYTSLTRADYLQGVKEMGYSSYWMEVPSTGGTALTDAIWQVRYQLGQTGDFPSWVKSVWTDGTLSIARSRYLLPAGLLVSAWPTTMTDLPRCTREEMQRYLGKQLLGLTDFVTTYEPTKFEHAQLTTNENQTVSVTIDDAAKRDVDDELAAAPVETASIRYSFFVKGKQALYFDAYSLTGTELRNPLNHSMDVSINGKFVRTDFPINADNGLVALGEAEDSYVTVRIVVRQDFSCESFGVFGLSLDALDEACQTAATANPVTLTYEDAAYHITCQNNTAATATLVLAIPYEEGYQATVNGRPADVYRVNTCQTAVIVPPGESGITLRFTPPGLYVAFGLCALGILLGVLGWCLRRKIPAAFRKFTMNCSEMLAKATFVAILAFVYLVPVVIYVGAGFVKILTWLIRG